MAKHDIAYVRIQTTNDLGYLVRTHRKNKQLTLETFAELSNYTWISHCNGLFQTPIAA